MLTYKIEKKSKEPLYVSLYRQLREDIAENKITAGTKLPSKRSFSEHLGVSVITVEYAYRLLADEGYIYSSERSGYFVSDLENVILPANDRHTECSLQENTSQTDTDFPFPTYSKIARQVLSNYGEQLIVKAPHNGCTILRNAISDYLFRYRGITAPPENIVIGSGAEYLYAMIVQLLGRDSIYGLENPSYEKIRKVYEANGAECEMLSLDDYGISTHSLNSTNARIIHVTPYKSYPTGVTAPASKRFEYLAWAKKNNGIIIEDDFASEFSVNTKPIETIFSMNKDSNVIYINTFSKSLTSAIRIGYMLLPDHLVKTYEEKLGFYSCTVPVIDQYVLAEFINSGSFERHLNRMRRKYKKSADPDR